MKIVIASATTFEIAPLLQYLDQNAKKLSFFEYKLNDNILYPLVTGVGALNMAFGLTRCKDISETDLALNVGLAGSYDLSASLGSVVEVTSDRFADLGVEEADGSFTDVYDLGLTNKDQFPYDDGWINNRKRKLEPGLLKVRGLTVNKVHGCAESIAKIKSKYKADVESMEGAGFQYACNMMDLHGHQIRALSNYVEPRKRENWKINEAIDSLNKTLIDLLLKTQ